MAAKLTLTIQGGSLDGSEYAFENPVRCVIGRSEDCTVQLPNSGWEFKMVSRHHCLLDVDPPHVSVRDLGSRNGTYINGRSIGLRADDESPASVADMIFASYDLKNGDVLSVGPVSFGVQVTRVETAKGLLEPASEPGASDADAGAGGVRAAKRLSSRSHAERADKTAAGADPVD